MARTAPASDGLSPERRRRILQILFVFVNLALVEAHLPGPLWLAIGGLFWVALIAITLAGSPLVCGVMCWIGAIQDIFEPFARPRIRLDARFGRALTFAVVVLWMPIGWLLLPAVASHDRVPIDLSPVWQRHLFQIALGAGVALSVVFLGKRGICRYLCPFTSIVATLRRALPKRRARSVTPVAGTHACAGCRGCAARDGATPVNPYEGVTTS